MELRSTGIGALPLFRWDHKKKVAQIKGPLQMKLLLPEFLDFKHFWEDQVRRLRSRFAYLFGAHPHPSTRSEGGASEFHVICRSDWLTEVGGLGCGSPRIHVGN